MASLSSIAESLSFLEGGLRDRPWEPQVWEQLEELVTSVAEGGRWTKELAQSVSILALQAVLPRFGVQVEIVSKTEKGVRHEAQG